MPCSLARPTVFKTASTKINAGVSSTGSATARIGGFPQYPLVGTCSYGIDIASGIGIDAHLFDFDSDPDFDLDDPNTCVSVRQGGYTGGLAFVLFFGLAGRIFGMVTGDEHID